MKRALCIALAACCMIAVVGVQAVPVVRGWSNGGYSSNPASPDYGTHDWIADVALALQTRDTTFLSSTYHARYLLGTEAPDNPEYIGDSTNHHVYFRATGEVQDNNSAVRASQMYQLALGYLETRNYEAAAYDIGAMTHYISDVGVFGHTMGSGTDWGAETHHQDYESAVQAMTSSLHGPTGSALGNESAYAATIGLAHRITFGGGVISTNCWMDDHYNWADPVFKASALASLNESVLAVAAVVNHLLVEASPAPPGVEPLPTPSPTVPQTPGSLSAVMTGKSVFLTWSAPLDDGGSPLTGYRIYRGETIDTPKLLGTVEVGTQTWDDTTISRGKTYYYWIVAENSVGASVMSDVTSLSVPKDAGPPIIPIALSAIASTILASIGVFTWRRRRTNGRP